MKFEGHSVGYLSCKTTLDLLCCVLTSSLLFANKEAAIEGLWRVEDR